MTTKAEANARRRFLRAFRRFIALHSNLERSSHGQCAAITSEIVQVEARIVANYNPATDGSEISECFALLSHHSLTQLPDDQFRWISFDCKKTQAFLNRLDIDQVRTAIAKGWDLGASLPSALAWSEGNAARESFICDEMASRIFFFSESGVPVWQNEETYTLSDPALLGRCLAAQTTCNPDAMRSAAHDAIFHCYPGVVRILLRSGAPKPEFSSPIYHPGILDELHPPSNHVALARLAEGRDIAGLIARTIADPELFPERAA